MLLLLLNTFNISFIFTFLYTCCISHSNAHYSVMAHPPFCPLKKILFAAFIVMLFQLQIKICFKYRIASVVERRTTRLSADKAIYPLSLTLKKSKFCFNPQTYCRTIFGIVHLDFREN